MLSTNAPGKLVLPFANAGAKNMIPVPSQIAITPGAASYTDGFPPLTMETIIAGGVPPSGQDFNGIFYALSALSLWYNAGAGFPYDAAFSGTIGGYPLGARVLRADGSGYWRSVVENNTSNPDTGGAGWAFDGATVAPVEYISSVYASAQQTLNMGTSKILFDTVEFDDGLWTASNNRFTASVTGKYRLSGSIMLSSPNPQELATQIWKNGSLAKQCFQAPQVSDQNLTLPFEAIFNLAAGDYLEAYLNVTQSSVLAGQVGSNQAYVFAQCEYIGA